MSQSPARGPRLGLLSLGPTVFPSIVRSFKTSTDVKGTKFGPETENVPDDALMIRSGPNGSKILEIDLTKLNNPSGYFDFEWAGTRIKDFSSYLVIIPIDKGDTVLHDDRYHSPNSYEFNVLDDSLMDFEQFTPEPPQISYSGGYTRAVFPPVRHGEITFILKSRFWQSVGSTTQWISGIIFGIFATFLVAVIGFRV